MVEGFSKLRPIGVICDDPKDGEVLTPSDFIWGIKIETSDNQNSGQNQTILTALQQPPGGRTSRKCSYIFASIRTKNM